MDNINNFDFLYPPLLLVRNKMFADLYIKEPRFEFFGSLHAMGDVPDGQVEGASGEEALVGGVVLFLSSKIPCHKGNALESCLTLFHSLEVGPVTDHDTHCRDVSVGSFDPMEVWQERRIGG